MPPMVKTFSGTNCLVSGWASTDVGYITDATIWIGGSQLRTVTNTDITKTRLDISVVFDSTHFAHDASIQLLVVGHNTSGQEGRSNRIYQDKIYNKSSVFCRKQFEDTEAIANLVRTAFNGMNHGATSTSAGGWTKQNVLASVKVDTALHYSTHATQTTMTDDSAQPPGGSGGVTITTGEVNSAMGQRTAVVPINVVLLNGCSSASHVDWETAFGIGDNSVDRVFVGWDAVMYFPAAQSAADTFWACMEGQNKAEDAIASAMTTYTTYPNNQYPNAHLISRGDELTKLHGVYEGSGWWK